MYVCRRAWSRHPVQLHEQQLPGLRAVRQRLQGQGARAQLQLLLRRWYCMHALIHVETDLIFKRFFFIVLLFNTF